jgi:N-acetylneuraminate synthase
MTNVFIIAETGVNHNGDLNRALQLVECAAESGADAVKFQTFNAKDLATACAEKTDYQKKTTGSEENQLSMLKQLQLSEPDHLVLADYCQQKNIQFLSSPFDLKSLQFLTETMKLETIKIASGEISNGPLLLSAARNCKKIILSTGMSTLDEITQALQIIAFGLKNNHGSPEKIHLSSLIADLKISDGMRERITLLHCTSEYPTPFSDINLRAMDSLTKHFGLPVGLSDHSLGINVPIAATALGAILIEKHFTLDRTLPGPDHPASLEPIELKQMVTGIREIEQALGSDEKKPMASELKNRIPARKSLVAAKEITKGEVFTEQNLAIKRPGSGVSPMQYWNYLDKPANRAYKKDEHLD